VQILFIKSFQKRSDDEDSIDDLGLPEANDKPINVYWKHPRCECLRLLKKKNGPNVPCKSSCGNFADLRGPHQKVVSYSFYGDTSSGYFKGIAVNMDLIRNLYQDWVVRVYHDIAPTNVKGSADLCELICSYPEFDDCYVGDLERDFKDLPKKFGMLWRFMVMGDPSVDIFAVRDLDSPVYQREVDAVNDWLAANKTWHIMRDNPMHVTSILGGMWGAKNTDNLTLMQTLRQQILNKAKHAFKSYDQTLLGMIVWPEAKKSMVAHDSFLCDSYEGSKPWPTQRANRTFVGDMYGISITRECPEKCRPPNHKDWKYC